MQGGKQMRWDLPEMECLILYANANLHGNTELTIVNKSDMSLLQHCQQKILHTWLNNI